MQKNSKKERPQIIMSIPSMFLSAISTTGSITGFSDPEVMTYDFAQRVNKICCDFLRENMIDNYAGGDSPSDFQKFNHDVLSHFCTIHQSKLFGRPYGKQMHPTKKDCEMLDPMNEPDSARNIFERARSFYHSICLRMPAGRDIELRNQMEALHNMFYVRSFPVYVVFDMMRSRLIIKDSYPDRKYKDFENWAKKDCMHSESECSQFDTNRHRLGEYVESMKEDPFTVVIDQDVRIPVKEATFFIRDNEATDKFALKQVKLSEALAKHVRENEDF